MSSCQLECAKLLWVGIALKGSPDSDIGIHICICRRPPLNVYTHMHNIYICATKVNCVLCMSSCREKQGRAYGNLGWCYQTLKQYPQAVFCHNKVCLSAAVPGDPWYSNKQHNTTHNYLWNAKQKLFWIFWEFVGVCNNTLAFWL